MKKMIANAELTANVRDGVKIKVIDKEEYLEIDGEYYSPSIFWYKRVDGDTEVEADDEVIDNIIIYNEDTKASDVPQFSSSINLEDL